MTYANLVTLFRLLMIPLFLVAVTYGRIKWAFFIFLAAGVSDLMDGILARVCGEKTPFGAILDPMADKLILTTAFISLSLPSSALAHPMPVWLPVLTISRDVFIVVLALLMNITLEVKRFPPSIFGKVCTFFQISYTVGILLQNSFGLLGAVVSGLMWAVVSFTVLSGLHYLWRAKMVSKEKG